MKYATYQLLAQKIAGVQTQHDVDKLAQIIQQIPDNDGDKAGLSRMLAQKMFVLDASGT